MKLTTVKFLIGQALVSIKRNGMMSLASTGTVAISMFVLGTFLLLALNANLVADTIESNVEIAVLLDADATPEEINSTYEDIVALDGVLEVTHIPKEEALDRLSRQFGEEHDLLQALGGVNPLPDSFIVKVENPRMVGEVAEVLSRFNYVDKVRYGKGLVEKLFSILDWVRWLGTAVVVLLSLAAVFLIAITIRLTVFARREEITIMKYVGATNWFIRWPFFLEGLFLGTLGSLLATAALYYSYSYLVGYVAASISFIPLITDREFLLQVLLCLLAGGAVLGAVGSAISVRRFLKV
ncbi:MAG: ABC transporter permease [Thermoanaerobacteraceae bacterium]|nr:ABC transporter permease [Thermoanaerobacteraceae bacterium]